MIKKFNQFISEGKDSGYLLYYAFDWDDNILYMPTVIHLEKREGDSWVPTDVSTAEFANVRNDKENYRITDGAYAFIEFRDDGKRGDNAFLEDGKKAISQGKLGPAWEDFIECLTSGSLFAIITARGHEAPAMRKGVEWIIDNVLTDDEKNELYSNLLKFAYIFKEEGEHERILRGQPSNNNLVKVYLDNCDFVGVSSPSRGGSPENPEKSKEEALLQFNSKVNNFAKSVGMKAKIGFSDDDLKNVIHIENLIDNLHNEQFPHIVEFVVKGTKNPLDITKKVRKMNVSESQAPGLESSVLPYTQFNNMTNKLYPSGPIDRQDDYKNQNRRQTEYLTKTSKDIFGKDNKAIDKKLKKMKKSSK